MPSDLGESPLENFRSNRSCLGTFFMLFPYFVYITHFAKFTRGIFAHGKIFAHGDRKGKKVHDTKRKKKNRPKKERKYHSVKKRKNFFVKVTGTDGAPRWGPDFEQRSRRQTKTCHT